MAHACWAAHCVVLLLPSSQQRQHTCITCVQRRLNGFDVGPIFYKCYTNTQDPMLVQCWSTVHASGRTLNQHEVNFVFGVVGRHYCMLQTLVGGSPGAVVQTVCLESRR